MMAFIEGGLPLSAKGGALVVKTQTSSKEFRFHKWLVLCVVYCILFLRSAEVFVFGLSNLCRLHHNLDVRVNPKTTGF